MSNQGTLEIICEHAGPVAEAYFDSRAWFSGIIGSLGSGKTHATILKLLTLMADQEPNQEGIRPTRLIVIRNHYPDLLTTTIKDWREITNRIAPIRLSHPPEQDLRWLLPDSTQVHCNVVFLALDREEDVKKLRGTQATFCWLSEGKELPKPVVDMAGRALGRYPSPALGGVQATNSYTVCDSNAPDEDHWMWQMKLNPEPDYEWFVQPGGMIRNTTDSPWKVNKRAENINNLPDQYYERLARHKNDDWISVNLGNIPGSSFDGRKVYSEYVKEIHVRQFEPRVDLPIVFGTDWGLEPAMVWGQVIDGSLHVFDELATFGFSALEMAKEAKERRRASWPNLHFGQGYGDPADPRSQADKKKPSDVMKAEGFAMVELMDKTNNFTLRRDAVGRRLMSLTPQGVPELVIHPRCKVVAKGFDGGYFFKRKPVLNDESFKNEPEKNMYSHSHDALQNLCLGLGDAKKITAAEPKSDWGDSINNRRRGGQSRNARPSFR